MSYIELLGTAIGLLYLWYEYHASRWVWVTGIIMPAIYIYVYWQAGLYADFAINIYYVLAAGYGWWAWQRRKGNDQQTYISVTRCPRKKAWALTFVALILWGAIGILLLTLTNSNVPWSDSFTTALGIVGMYMLARKYLEQWWVWVAVDAVCVVLYIYKGLYPTAALYALYTGIAMAGYYKWKKLCLMP